MILFVVQFWRKRRYAGVMTGKDFTHFAEHMAGVSAKVVASRAAALGNRILPRECFFAGALHGGVIGAGGERNVRQ
jgi:hypothetical protein